jgi:MFS family permease
LSEQEKQGLTAPLRIRNFRLLFSAQVASNLGDWFDFLALAVLIAYAWNYGPTALAALAIVVALPWIVVAPFAGVLADRWPKRSVMIGADLARAALVFGFIFAPNIYVLLVLVGLKTIFSTLFQPAEQATIRMVVPEAELNSANALSQIVIQSTKVLGPALGGVVVGLTTPRVCFAIDAATFLVSAAILSRMGRVEAGIAEAEAEVDGEGEPGFWGQFREGLAYIASRRALLISIGTFAAVTFLLLTFDSLSVLALRELGVGRTLFGVAIAAIGLGGVLGALATGRWAGDLNPFVMLGAATAVIGGLVALMGLALVTDLGAPTGVWAPVLLVIGFASAGVFVASPTILQRETPPELMGRVASTSYSLPTVCQLAGPIVGAALAEWQSVGFVFAVAGSALAAVGVVVFALHPPVGVGVRGAETADPILAAPEEGVTA